MTNDKELKTNQIEHLANWAMCPDGFYTDDAYYKDRVPKRLLTNSLYEIVADRVKLRYFCSDNKITIPGFTFANKQSSLTSWAIKTKYLPLVMKTLENRSDGNFSLVLRGFREFPDSFEYMETSNTKEIILEQFIETENIIEITVLDGKIRLVSHVGLEKSMNLRHSWRVFPLQMPLPIYEKIQIIINRFSELISVKGVPFRFSIALHDKKIILLSLNAGMNRPEYNPQWTSAAKIENIFESPDEKTSGRLCKLMIFYNLSDSDFSVDELKKVGGKSLCKFASMKDTTFVLISCSNSPLFLEASKKISAFFRHIQTEKSNII